MLKKQKKQKQKKKKKDRRRRPILYHRHPGLGQESWLQISKKHQPVERED